MLIGYQKCKPSLDSRIPITPAILIQLVNDLQHTSSSAFLCCLLRAMFILAFCAFLRVGEITKTTGSSQHFLLFEHISIHRGVDHLQLIDNNIPHFKHSKSNVTTLRLHQNTKKPGYLSLISTYPVSPTKKAWVSLRTSFLLHG